jgi:hypothetical protein
MAMGYAIAAVDSGEDGQLRFSVICYDHSRGSISRVIFGTDPDEAGFTEPKLRQFLANAIGLTLSDIEKAVCSATARVSNGA